MASSFKARRYEPEDDPKIDALLAASFPRPRMAYAKVYQPLGDRNYL